MSPFLVGITILVISFILQSTLVPYLRVAGVQPDLVLIVVVIYALVEDPLTGSIAGFFGGLLEDLVSIRFVGLNALCKTIIGYLSGLLERAIFVETVFLSMVAVFIASVLDKVLYMGLLFLVGDPVPFFATLRGIALPQALYNSLLSPLVYFVFMKVITRGEKKPQLVERYQKSSRIKG